MAELEYAQHALDMIEERQIDMKWVDATLGEPYTVEEKDDGTRHYVRSIGEREGRYLRVVVDPEKEPGRIITVFRP